MKRLSTMKRLAVAAAAGAALLALGGPLAVSATAPAAIGRTVGAADPVKSKLPPGLTVDGANHHCICTDGGDTSWGG